MTNIIFRDVHTTRYSQVTRLVSATKASGFKWRIDQGVSRAALHPTGPILIPPRAERIELRMSWDLLERTMQSFLQENSSSWPLSLHVVPLHCSLPAPETRATVLELTVRMYEQFSLPRQTGIVLRSESQLFELALGSGE